MHASDIDILPTLWDKLPKCPDADHITYTQDDIDILWQMGFVDTERYALDEWRAEIKPHCDAEGYYVLSRAQFLDLEKYRYRGVLYAPLDAHDINEGFYTDEGLQELIDLSIAPECGLPSAELTARIADLKTAIRADNGLLRVDKHVKHQFAAWLQEHPSPMRRLELLLAASFAEQGIDIDSITADEPGSLLPAPPARVGGLQASAFSMTSHSPIDERIRALKQLEKAKVALPPQDPPPDGGTPLKQLTRSRRGLRS